MEKEKLREEGLMIFPMDPFELEGPQPNKYGYISKNNCKSKKELRAWIQQQNKKRKAKA